MVALRSTLTLAALVVGADRDLASAVQGLGGFCYCPGSFNIGSIRSHAGQVSLGRMIAYPASKLPPPKYAASRLQMIISRTCLPSMRQPDRVG